MDHKSRDAGARLVSALSEVVPLEFSQEALALGESLIEPQRIGQLVAALDLPLGARVLHVGTGSGYTAAVLSRVADEVVSIERTPHTANAARRRLADMGYSNVDVRVGDDSSVHSDGNPFDGVLYSAHVEAPSGALIEQLKEGVRIAMVGLDDDSDHIRVFQRKGDGFVPVEEGVRRRMPLLGELLVNSGLVPREKAEEAALAAGRTGRPIGALLVGDGLIEERDLYRALAVQKHLGTGPFDSLRSRLRPEVAKAAPRTFLDYNELIPIAVDGDTLCAATSNPKATFSELMAAFGASKVEAHLLPPTDIRRLWAAIDLDTPAPEDAEEDTALNLLLDEKHVDAHLVALFEAILLDAVAERASDIHLEVYGARVRLRLRIDGELRDSDRFRLRRGELLGLVNIIKIRAHLDIAERRLPQGGRYSVLVGEQGLDLRVQTQPSLHGEHVIVRLLPHKNDLIRVDQLGMSLETGARYRRLLESPSGLVLVVGPTGSGKSTTLYAGLSELAAQSTKKVITIEDPVEYSLVDIQQCQVRPEIDFHFADAMRVFVREDPDVIFVGEIRDSETALEALRASQTGHLVLSTLHCNDTTDAAQRLIDLNMHPNSIAAELRAVLAQRLAKRNCQACLVPSEVPKDLSLELFGEPLPPDGFTAFKGKGCSRCRGRGTRGRVALVELLETSKAIRSAISRTVPVDEMRDMALAEPGFVTMRDEALRLVVEGLIAISELKRLLPPDRMMDEGTRK